MSPPPPFRHGSGGARQGAGWAEHESARPPPSLTCAGMRSRPWPALAQANPQGLGVARGQAVQPGAPRPAPPPPVANILEHTRHLALGPLRALPGGSGAPEPAG